MLIRQRGPHTLTCVELETAKLNGVDPQAWLPDIIGRISDHKISRRSRVNRTNRAKTSDLAFSHDLHNI